MLLSASFSPSAPSGTVGGYVSKPYALLHTRFSEVLLLDSDSHPLRDPTFLFDDELYLQNGVLAWSDFHRPVRYIDPRIFAELGLKEPVARVCGEGGCVGFRLQVLLRSVRELGLKETVAMMWRWVN